MWRQLCKNLLTGAASLAVFAGCALAYNHHNLNGGWQLIPERSEFHGESIIQTGRVTIADRQGNIYVSRSFNYDEPNRSTSSTFETMSPRRRPSGSPASKAKRSGRAISCR